MTPRQFFNITRGYQNKQIADLKTSWLQTREVIYFNYLLTDTGKKKKLNRDELMPFEWEKEEKPKATVFKNVKQIESLFKNID